MDLNGRVVVVSGAASGIGRACANSLAGAGARLGLLDLQEETLFEAQGEIESAGGHVASAVCNVADREQVERAIEKVHSGHGLIDGLVAAAGISRRGAPAVLHETDDETWRSVLDVNVMGLVNLARAVLPDMQASGHGTVVGFGSTYSFLGAPQLAPYAASKAAIVQVIRSIARDYGPHGVRANAICPGWIDTPLLRTDVALSGDFDEVLAPVRERTFLDRIGRPSEIAEVCLFLTSNSSSYVTGSVIVADGGYSVA